MEPVRKWPELGHHYGPGLSPWLPQYSSPLRQLRGRGPAFHRPAAEGKVSSGERGTLGDSPGDARDRQSHLKFAGSGWLVKMKA
jgi:hypothetical protein